MSVYEPTGREKYGEQPGTGTLAIRGRRRKLWCRRLRRMGNEAGMSFVRGLGTTASGLLVGFIVIWTQR